jgi:hypothetical protein
VSNDPSIISLEAPKMSESDSAREAASVPANSSALLGWQRIFLLGLLVTIYCGYNLFVQPISLPASGSAYWMPALMSFTVAEMPLLAMWMMLGTEGIGRRMSIGLVVFILLSGSISVGTMLNASGYAHEAVVEAMAFAVQLALVCLPLITLRRRYRWSIEIQQSDSQPRSSGQFSLLSMMFWTFEIAAWLMFLRFLGRISFQATVPIFGAEAFGRAALMGLFFFLAAVPLLPLAWFVLSRGATRMFAAILWAGITATLGGLSYVLLVRLGSEPPAESLLGVGLVIAGIHAGAVLPLAILLISGYRIMRDHDSAPRSDPTNEAAAATGLKARFVLPLTILLLPLAGIIWHASRIIPVRLQQLDQQKWMKIGLISYYDQGRLVKFEPTDQVLNNEQLQAIETLESIPIIDLQRSPIPTAQLEALRQLPNLRELIVSGAPISDSDLKLVGAMSTLETLYLDSTNISDAGLPELEHLTALRQLDLTATKASAKGIAKLRKALPSAKIVGP